MKVLGENCLKQNEVKVFIFTSIRILSEFLRTLRTFWPAGVFGVIFALVVLVVCRHTGKIIMNLSKSPWPWSMR